MKRLIFILCCLIGLQLASYAASSNKQPLTVENVTQAQLDELTKNDSVQKASIAQLKKEQERLSNEKDYYRNRAYRQDMILPIAICSAAFATAIIMLVSVMYFSFRNRKIKYATWEKIAESRPENLQEIYKTLADSDNTGYKKHLNKGIQLFFLGVGLAIMLGMFMRTQFMSIGILITCIGTGEILIGFLQKRDEEKHALPTSCAQSQPIHTSNEEPVAQPSQQAPAKTTDSRPATSETTESTPENTEK